jgi:hypothetical protein
MAIQHVFRHAARVTVALVLAAALFVGSKVTPTASAARPGDCASLELNVLILEGELRSLQQILMHLLQGGVTRDEVVYVNRALEAISAAQDELNHLKALAFECLRRLHLPQIEYRAIVARVTKAQKTGAKLKARAVVAVRVARRR